MRLVDSSRLGHARASSAERAAADAEVGGRHPLDNDPDLGPRFFAEDFAGGVGQRRDQALGRPLHLEPAFHGLHLDVRHSHLVSSASRDGADANIASRYPRRVFAS